MALVNWIIVAAYILAIILIGYLAGRSQKNREDYFLGGRRVSPWLVALSLMANQVSAISLVSAPAFIAVRGGGGLKWLQYELAVPLAMVFIMAFLVPVFRSTSGISIFEFLENRFGRSVRLALSLIYMVNRSIGGGVILLATSYVTAVLLKLDIYTTVLLVGAVSMAYTAIGGILADIYTDVIQLVVLWVSSAACIVVIIQLVGGFHGFSPAEAGRLIVYNFHSPGVGDGETFSFWPMLFGGFFLYVSYYGCDQSQAQRLLATSDFRGSGKALLVNGIARFPLVATYCSIGVLMILFLARNPDFAGRLKGLPPDYLMPLFFTGYLPDGLLGMVVVGILAASMSSLDSTINSLSAVTWEDFLVRFSPRLASLSGRRAVWLSRLVTVLWGTASLAFALVIAGRSETIIELVNKTGSALYGPIAAVFILGIFFRKVSGKGALAGLACGIAANIILWIFFEKQVSWMWWNLTGFAAAVIVALVQGAVAGGGSSAGAVRLQGVEKKTAIRYGIMLMAWFAAIVIACAAIERLLEGLAVR
ncbi:MAG TPA: sodium/solute symporter [Spirochaetota bacterium]|nr:sodium/solute symporter [Spirochaetota bacterium]HPV39534.1 sodium/solute symporter [Spirochaetota bacterium]